MAELTHDEKLAFIESALQKGLEALTEAKNEIERKDGLLAEMSPLIVGYMHLIRSDYEGRNGLMGSMEEEYRKVVAVLDKARGMGVSNV